MKMKEFNLNEYLNNPLQKVVTRDGRKARIIYTNAEGRFPIVALVLNKEGNEHPFSYTKYGLWSENGESDLDLFFESIKKEGWINIYKGKNDIRTLGRLFSSEEEAIKNKDFFDYIATVKVEWEE